MKKKYIIPNIIAKDYQMPIMAPVTSFGVSGKVEDGDPEEDGWEFGGGGNPDDDPDIRERPGEWTITNSLW